MNGPLHDKVALVTGGSRGIGQAIAIELAAAGAAVAFTYKTGADGAAETQKQIEELGGFRRDGSLRRRDAPALSRGHPQSASREMSMIDTLCI